MSTADPLFDADRLAALRELDTGGINAPDVDRLCAVAARLLRAPMALISAVDDAAQTVLGAHGTGAALEGTRTFPLDASICRHVVAGGVPLAIPDLSRDPRTAELAERRGVRGYLGVPVRAEPGGPVIGSLCVLDHTVRPWSEDDVAALSDLAVAVEAYLAHHLAQTRRRRTEAHYQRLVEASPLSVLTVDVEGVVREMNPAGAAIMGRKVEEVVGHHFAQLVDPADLERAGEVVQRIFSGQSASEEIELNAIRPNGERRRVKSIARPIVDGGETVGLHSVAWDVTEAREQEARLRLLYLAMESLSEGVRLVGKDGDLRYANQATLELLGEEGDHCLEPPLRDVRVQADVDGRWSGLIWRTDEQGVRKPIDLLCVRVQLPGGEHCYFSISRDATSRIAAEQSVRRTDRLETLGTLVGGVAHELNNPLAAIQGFASLMLLDERGPEDREALEMMQREAERAARIVADLRQLGRQTRESTAEITREPVDVNDVVVHVLRLRAYTHATNNIQILADLAEEPGVVRGDRARLEQVVLNLVINAEQALNGRPRRCIEVRTRPSSGGLTLSVIDSGGGIAPAVMERIFDPFFTTKGPGRGTGLGLALVHSIVAEHGGQVTVESELGRGSTFQVKLPAEPAQPRPAAPAAAAEARRSLHVLVVDDEEPIRRTLQRLLTRRGHRVELAGDGGEALRRIAQAGEERFDVMLSDLRMPGLGGEALYRTLQARGDGSDRRLIFVSGDTVSPDAARLLADAEVPVILKPFDLEEVARMVEAKGEGGRGNGEVETPGRTT